MGGKSIFILPDTKTARAAFACPWVNAATFRSTARCVKNASTSDTPISFELPLAMKQNKAPRPIDVRILGANGIVSGAYTLAHLIQ